MQTLESIKQLVSEVKYLDWDIMVRQYVESDRPYIQVQFDAPCNNSGRLERQYCRKWSLSLHMTNSEVIDTAYKAVHGAVEHEMNEKFTFRGQRIKNPHFDLEQLAEFCKMVSSSKRDEGIKVNAEFDGNAISHLMGQMGYRE